MKQKDAILCLLQTKEAMTQGELAKAIYGDKAHSPHIHTALMSLVNNNVVVRAETYPAKYSLCKLPITGKTVEPEIALQKSAQVQVLLRNAQKIATMSAETATRLITDYFNETVEDKHGRYKSWVHCYKVFSESRNVRDEQRIDYLALHLAFYLASWGMYRGSSFLLQKDYKVHIPIVKIIQEPKYDPLLGITANELCKEESLSLLDEIGCRIKDCYAKETPSFDGVKNNATDTLTTKILLGTLGCVPAFDRYYVQSVKKHHISGGTFNRDSVYQVAKFYCDNFNKFENLRHQLSDCNIVYPPMKLMDMCFWQDAYMDDLKQ